MNLKYISTIIFLIVNICCYAQKDTTIYENNKIIGKGVYKDNLETGHWKWYSTKNSTVRNVYYINGSILAINKDSVTNKIEKIELLQGQDSYNPNINFDICAAFYFDNDTLKSTQISNFNWCDFEAKYFYSYQYYPNGLPKSRTDFLKATGSRISSMQFNLKGGITSETKQTDSTDYEIEYYENGFPKCTRHFILKKIFLKDLRYKLDTIKPVILPINLDKNGEWLYYNESGKIIKKEIYREDKLMKTINY